VVGVVDASMACSIFGIWGIAGAGRSGYGNAACALGTAALPGMMWENTVLAAGETGPALLRCDRIPSRWA
jgi:hypothetical protein